MHGGLPQTVHVSFSHFTNLHVTILDAKVSATIKLKTTPRAPRIFWY